VNDFVDIDLTANYAVEDESIKIRNHLVQALQSHVGIPVNPAIQLYSSFISHSTRHLLPWQHTCMSLTSNRPSTSVRQRVSMGSILPFEAPLLHYTLEPLALGDSSDVYMLTRHKVCCIELRSCW
jgi:hypothetical protein